MDITGTITDIGNTVQVTDKFRKREFVVEYEEKEGYKEYLKFEAHQDKCDLLNNFWTGQKVEVFFNLRGKPFTNKKGETVYYNSLVVWKLEGRSGVGQPAGGKANSGIQQSQEFDNSIDDGLQDDLPF